MISLQTWKSNININFTLFIISDVIAISSKDAKTTTYISTDLLGEGELDSLAVGGAKAGDALVHGLSDGLNLGDGDAFLLGEVLTADSGQADGLVHAGLDGLGVDNLDLRLDNGDHGGVVASLLGDLLAVVVAIAVISISGGGLAHSHHLDVALLVEGDLDSLGVGLLGLLGVLVDTDLVVDDLGGLGTDGGGHGIAHLHIDDLLDGQLHVGALSGEGGCADLSGLNHINNAAVVLGGLIGVVGGRGVVGGGGVVNGVMSHNRGGVMNGVNWGVVNSVDGGVVNSVDRGVVNGVDGGVVNGVSHGGVDSVSHDGGGVVHSVGGVVSNSVTGSSEMGEGSEGNVSLGGGESQGEEGGQAESLNIEKFQL